MSTPTKPTNAAAARGSQPTLIARSVPKKFRRSGLDFSSEWQSWPLADLKKLWGAEYDAKLAAIRGERMLAAEIVTAEEAATKARPARTAEDLGDENASLRARLAELEGRLAALEAPKG